MGGALVGGIFAGGIFASGIFLCGTPVGGTFASFRSTNGDFYVALGSTMGLALLFG